MFLLAGRRLAGGFCLLESPLQVALGGAVSILCFPRRPLPLLPGPGRLGKVFFEFSFLPAVAFPDFGPAGSGGGEFRPDGAIRADELPQTFAPQRYLQRALLALIEADEGALLVPEILHFAPVAAGERCGLQPLFHGSFADPPGRDGKRRGRRSR